MPLALSRVGLITSRFLCASAMCETVGLMIALIKLLDTPFASTKKVVLSFSSVGSGVLSNLVCTGYSSLLIVVSSILEVEPD